MKPLELAIQFHEIYERLAPSFGFVPRTDTRKFDPESKNGRLMVAVCREIQRMLQPVTPSQPQEAVEEAVFQKAVETIANAIAATNGKPDVTLIAEWLEVGGLLRSSPKPPVSELESLEKRLAAINQSGTRVVPVDFYRDAIAALRAAEDRARGMEQDARRLDFLERTKSHATYGAAIKYGTGWYLYVPGRKLVPNDYAHDTLRAAIDEAALKSTESEP